MAALRVVPAQCAAGPRPSKLSPSASASVQAIRSGSGQAERGGDPAGSTTAISPDRYDAYRGASLRGNDGDEAIRLFPEMENVALSLEFGGSKVSAPVNGL